MKKIITAVSLISLLIAFAVPTSTVRAAGWEPCLDEIFIVLDALASYGGQGVRPLSTANGAIRGFIIEGGLTGLTELDVGGKLMSGSELNTWLEGKGEVLSETGETTVMIDDFDECPPLDGLTLVPNKSLWVMPADIKNLPWAQFVGSLVMGGVAIAAITGFLLRGKRQVI